MRALVLIGTGLSRGDVLRRTQVELPLRGLALYDANHDGALDPADVPLADPARLAAFLQAIRPQGQIFVLRYVGSGPDLHPVGLNPRLDTDGDGRLAFEREVRPVYEAFLAHYAQPLPVIERYADPAVLPTVVPAFAQRAQSEGALDASFMGEPADQNRRLLLGLPTRPRLLLMTGENDDQTPASSAQELAESLAAAGYPATLRLYPGLSRALSPQASIFAPYRSTMEAHPLQEMGSGWSTY